MTYVIRNDDVAQASDSSKRDEELAQFLEWAEYWGDFSDAPMYLGVVPAFVGKKEYKILMDIEAKSKAVISIHGWDHSKKILDEHDLIRALKIFPRATTVIPPFNLYDEDTIRAMAELGLTTIFGGFNGNSHNFGESPCKVHGVLHLNATLPLYDRCYKLAEYLEKAPGQPEYTEQIVLHHRWDNPTHLELPLRLGSLNGITKLHQVLSNNIVGVEDIKCITLPTQN